MDLLSILGCIFSIILMILGIVLNGTDTGYEVAFINLSNFYDLPSIAIVIGGTIAALMLSFPASYFLNVPKHLKIIFRPTKYNPISFIEQMVDFAKSARINGLLALEEKLTETEDPFLRNSLMLVVDAVEPEKVKTLMETELDYLDDRHSQARSFYDKGAAYAPAFGMIGTLIGLINLLKFLDDPAMIAPSMAVALVTTFYGTVLSNILFLPISNKLKARHDEEYLCKMIISEGIQSIQSGDNPRFIQEKLTQLLPYSVAQKMGEAQASRESERDRVGASR